MIIEALFILLFQNVVLSLDDCHLGRDSTHKTSSTKTPYAFINKEDDVVSLPDCQSAQIWLLSRHGTRYPSKLGIQLIKERLPEMLADIVRNKDKGSLCDESIEVLKKWDLEDLSVENKKKLHPEGEMEMIALAERFQKRLPGLISEDYYQEDFTFRSTSAQRAERSQFYFATGLFGRHIVLSEVQFDHLITPHDPLIRPYKVCPKWQKEVKKNPESLREKELFETSDEFKTKVIEPLSKRLGYDEDLSLHDLDALYNGCVFGQAWQPKRISPWCQVFSDYELDMLEYREDLEYYWQDGYGFQINSDLACVFVKDVLDNFHNVTENLETEERGIFYFSHSGSVLKLLAFLGLFRDSDTLRHDNFEQMRHQRRWRTSHFDAFGSNVAFVLQQCQNDYKVGLFVNEKLTVIPGCDENEWCPLSQLKKVFLSRIPNCDLKEICAVNEDENEYLKNVDDDRF